MTDSEQVGGPLAEPSDDDQADVLSEAAAVADGTADAAKRLHRVLTNDPGLGVARHVDAGYEKAEETARLKGVQVPMLEPISE